MTVRDTTTATIHAPDTGSTNRLSPPLPRRSHSAKEATTDLEVSLEVAGCPWPRELDVLVSLQLLDETGPELRPLKRLLLSRQHFDPFQSLRR